MTFRWLGAVATASILAVVWTTPASATSVKINGDYVFRTNYEGDSATALTFSDVDNTDSLDLDPTTTIVGNWYNPNPGTAIWERSSAANSQAYDVDSKQVQVTSSATGPDPGPAFGTGTNYLRGVRTSGGSTTADVYSILWEASPAPFTTVADDILRFETAVYVSSALSGTENRVGTLATFYDNDSNFGIRFRLNYNSSTGELGSASDLNSLNLGNTVGASLAFDAWKVLAIEYVQGADTWSLIYDGTTVGSIPVNSAAAGAGVVTFMSFGGGVNRVTTENGGNAVYFDAVTLHPGDFDGDGDVDGADFVAWQTNFPTASGATLAQGDADGDGDVDGADFVVWQTNFPFTPGPGASPVPEPQAVLLTAAAALILGGMRSYSRRVK